MNKAVISLGANINPQENIEKAKSAISETHILLAESEMIETKPIGYKNQPNFLNGAILISTILNKNDLADWLKLLEQNLGRVRTVNKYGPRKIDLDIVVWNGKIIDDDVYERDFLRNAVREVCVDLRI